MLTSQQYEAIGRLTVFFNAIDDVLTGYLPLIPRAGDFEPPPGLGGERNFRGRVAALERILEIASAKDQVAAIHAVGIITLLKRAAEVSAKRNEMAHAVVLNDFATNTSYLSTRKGLVVPDERAITDLAGQALWLAQQLAEQCEELLRYYGGYDEEPPLLEEVGDW